MSTGGAPEVIVVGSWAGRDRVGCVRVATRCDYIVHARSRIGIDKSRDRLRNSVCEDLTSAFFEILLGRFRAQCRVREIGPLAPFPGGH